MPSIITEEISQAVVSDQPEAPALAPSAAEPETEPGVPADSGESAATTERMTVANPTAFDDAPPKGIPGGVDAALRRIAALAREQGHLTYDQVYDYLPDETFGTEQIDALMRAIEGLGVELINDPNKPAPLRAADAASAADSPLLRDGLPSSSSDPIRMYLSQMSEIPLLTTRRRCVG